MPQQINVPGMGVVEFPDGMSDDQIVAAIKKNTPGPSIAASALDAAKSIPTGAAESVLGLADLPERGAQGIQKGVNLVQRLLGMEQTPRPGTVATDFNDRFNQINGGQELRDNWPTAASLQKKIEGVTGPFYQPETPAGQWAKEFGGFLPAVAGGPESLAARLMTRAAAPMAASEAAGAATKGTAAETPARLAGALLAGPAASRALAGRAPPTAGQLQQNYRDVVRDPAFLGTPLAATDPARIAGTMRGDLRAGGHDSLNSPVPYKRADLIEDFPASTPTGGQPPTVADLQAVRERLSADQRAAAGNQITGAPEAASRTAKRTIDQELSAIEPRYGEANTNYAISKASEFLQGKRDIALDRAAAANSGNNIGNTLRQRMVDILASPKASSKFTDPQLGQIEGVAQGTGPTNFARAWANRLGGGGGIGQTMTAALLGGAGAGAGYLGGGDLEGAAALGLAGAFAGRGFKAAENAMVQRQINRLDRGIRAGSPLGQKQPALSSADLDRVARALVRREEAASQSGE